MKPLIPALFTTQSKFFQQLIGIDIAYRRWPPETDRHQVYLQDVYVGPDGKIGLVNTRLASSFEIQEKIVRTYKIVGMSSFTVPIVGFYSFFATLQLFGDNTCVLLVDEKAHIKLTS